MCVVFDFMIYINMYYLIYEWNNIVKKIIIYDMWNIKYRF